MNAGRSATISGECSHVDRIPHPPFPHANSHGGCRHFCDAGQRSCSAIHGDMLRWPDGHCLHLLVIRRWHWHKHGLPHPGGGHLHVRIL